MGDKLKSWDEFIFETKQTPEGAVPTDVACPCCGNRLYKDVTFVLASDPPKHKYFCIRDLCKWHGFA